MRTSPFLRALLVLLPQIFLKQAMYDPTYQSGPGQNLTDYHQDIVGSERAGRDAGRRPNILPVLELYEFRTLASAVLSLQCSGWSPF